MKMLPMGRVVPLGMNSVVKTQLAPYYTKEELRTILKNTKREYQAVVARVPEMGGRDNFFVPNIFSGAYLIALYKQVRGKFSVEAFGEVVQNGIRGHKLLAKKMGKVDRTSPEYRRDMERAAAWAAAHAEEYPHTWQLRLPEAEKPGELYFEFTRCGLCTVCQNEGLPELTPVMCATDFETIAMGGAQLTRTKTLADGDDCCNFRVTKRASE